MLQKSEHDELQFIIEVRDLNTAWMFCKDVKNTTSISILNTTVVGNIRGMAEVLQIHKIKGSCSKLANKFKCFKKKLVRFGKICLFVVFLRVKDGY